MTIKHTEEFKRETVRIALTSGRSQGARCGGQGHRQMDPAQTDRSLPDD